MRVLIIEDDRDLCGLLKHALEQDGYTVDACHEGDDGLRYLLEKAHDLVLLDRMLPRMSGTELVKKARAEGISVPVLMMTALGQVDERVTGLDAGADDYIVKPFAVEELLARMRALGRRPSVLSDAALLSCGDIHLDASRMVLQSGESRCSLSKRETDLLSILIKNPNCVLARSTLLSNVWGPDAPVEEGNLENYISFLRRRLRSVGSSVTIRAVRGRGYCLECEDV